MHFFGTSNQTAGRPSNRVVPVARECGVDGVATEVALRIDYLDALLVHRQASAILLMGSSERHYTASKLYPALLARRPILAVYHRESSVTEILQRATRPPSVRLVTYDDSEGASERVEAIYTELSTLLETPVYDPGTVDLTVLDDFSGKALAGRLASIFDKVTANGTAT